MRDLTTTELANFVGCCSLPTPKHDPCTQLFAVLRVGYTDDLDILHLGVPVEKLFDLARIDVLAASNDHVLQAPHDIDVALLVHGG